MAREDGFSCRPQVPLFMPQDLPGFYYDVNRNRYFPINANRAPYAVPIPYTSSQTFDHSAVAGRQTAQASTSVSASVRADPSKGSNVHVDRPERVRRTTQLRRDLQRSFGAAERQKCLQYVLLTQMCRLIHPYHGPVAIFKPPALPA